MLVGYGGAMRRSYNLTLYLHFDSTQHKRQLRWPRPANNPALFQNIYAVTIAHVPVVYVVTASNHFQDHLL